MRITIHARGHENVRATHATTIEVTKEEHLTPRGDCIIAVGADKGLCDLTGDERKALQHGDITVTVSVGRLSWSVTGRGTPALSLTHPRDMVMRTSGHACPRTLMVGANGAARDMPRELARALADPDAEVTVTIDVTCPQDSTHARQSTRSESLQGQGQGAGKA